MPVILAPDLWPAWLGERELSEAELLALLQIYPADLMQAYPVENRVGSVRNNDPALLDPLVAA